MKIKVDIDAVLYDVSVVVAPNVSGYMTTWATGIAPIQASGSRNPSYIVDMKEVKMINLPDELSDELGIEPLGFEMEIEPETAEV